MGRRLRNSARKVGNNIKVENDLETTPNVKGKRRKREESVSSEGTISKAEADSTMVIDTSPYKTNPITSPSANPAKMSGKPTLLDLAHAAATVQSEDSKISVTSASSASATSTEQSQTYDITISTEHDSEDDEISFKRDEVGNETIDWRDQKPDSENVPESSEKTSDLSDVKSLNELIPNRESLNKMKDGVMEDYSCKNSAETCERRDEVDMPKEDARPGNSEQDPNSAESNTGSYRGNETSELTASVEPYETIITDENGNVLMSYNSNVPLDDLLKTLTNASGAGQEIVTNVSSSAMDTQVQTAEHFDVQSTILQAPNEEVYQIVGPHDTIQLPDLNQFLGHFDDSGQVKQIQYYTSDGQNCLSLLDKTNPSVKTKAAADRLRSLLRLPPEPRQGTQPHRPNPADPDLGCDYQIYRNLPPGVLPILHSSRQKLEFVTLTPVPVEAVETASIAQTQRLPRAGSDDRVEPEPEVSTGRRVSRGKYGSAIADLRRPTPLEAALSDGGAVVSAPEEEVERPKMKVLPPVTPTVLSYPPQDTKSSPAVDTWMTKSGRVKRPMNAFMVWSQKARPKVASMLTDPTNSKVSVTLGDMWREMTEEEKRPYFQEAHRIRLKHNQLFPDWIYKPKEQKRQRRPRHSSLYWKNFMKFGNVEGFRMPALQVNQESSPAGRSDYETAAATSSIMSEICEQMTAEIGTGTGNYQDNYMYSTAGSSDLREISDELDNSQTYSQPMSTHVAPPMSAHIAPPSHGAGDFVRQAFIASQQLLEDEKDSGAPTQSAEVCVGGANSSTQYHHNSLGHCQKAASLTPLQRAHMSRDYCAPAPFTTTNLVVPLKEPTSPPDQKPGRVKDRICFEKRARRPGTKSQPGYSRQPTSQSGPYPNPADPGNSRRAISQSGPYSAPTDPGAPNVCPTTSSTLPYRSDKTTTILPAYRHRSLVSVRHSDVPHPPYSAVHNSATSSFWSGPGVVVQPVPQTTYQPAPVSYHQPSYYQTPGHYTDTLQILNAHHDAHLDSYGNVTSIQNSNNVDVSQPQRNVAHYVTTTSEYGNVNGGAGTVLMSL